MTQGDQGFSHRRNRRFTIRRRRAEGLRSWALAESLEQRLLLAVLYVDLNAPGPLHDGASWESAYPDLQLALEQAQVGDEFHIAAGTYKPTTDADRTKSFQIKSGVALYGGYGGYNAANPDQRDVQLFPTILSGEIGDLSTTEDNSHHVVYAYKVDSTAILDGLTITAGNANGIGGISGMADRHGGGMYNICSSPILIRCTFSGNSAAAGGGMYNSMSWPTLTQCSFTANSAFESGSGMYNDSSWPTLTNCSFVTNAAPSGGGMYNGYSWPTLTNCSFAGNSAGSGGGMYNFAASPTLTNCIVWGNSSAIYNGGGRTPTVTYSLIQGGWEGMGNLDTDPQFVRSPWPGPDGVFGTADDDYGDLRLRVGSPALNGGSSAVISTEITTDLAGNARIQDGTVDLGVYEGAVAVPASKTLYVDQNATGSNTGASWSDAYTSLQSALAASVDGDAIRIADGTYMPTATADRAISFVLRNGVAIYGGYAGSGASNPDARDIALYPTILSGDIGEPGEKRDNSCHVVTALGVGRATILEGVTVTLGNANGTGLNQDGGGGLFLRGSSPTLSHCTVIGNSAFSYGGGMHNSFSSPMLTNCTFIGNSTSYIGGGISNSFSSPTLINCSIVASFAIASSGMFNYYSSPTLTNCIVWGNSSALGNHESSPTVTYSLIQGGWEGVGNLDTDPQFVRNPTPGPDGQWGTADDDYGDLRLQRASPAINAGSNDALPSNLITDLAGNPRLVGDRVDPGTYECQGDELTLAGSAGPDTFYLRRSASGSLEIYPAATPDGQPLQIIDSVDLRLTRLSLSGGAGDDCFILDFSQGNPLPGLGLSLSGGVGANRVILLGSNAAESFTISDAQVQCGTETTTLDEVQQIEFDGQGGLDTLSVGGLAQVRLRASQHLASLSINDSASVVLAAGANRLLRLSDLNLSEDAMLDLADNALIVSATPETKQAALAAISTAIRHAYQAKSWSGTGLTSSAAQTNRLKGLAVLLNDRGNGRRIISTFAKQPVTESDILVRYTWNGDVNLDGVIDAADYFRIDSGYITRKSGYQNGDLNFDSVVDAEDYALIDSAFTAQASALEVEEVPATAEKMLMKATTAPRPQLTPSVLGQLFSAKPVL